MIKVLEGHGKLWIDGVLITENMFYNDTIDLPRYFSTTLAYPQSRTKIHDDDYPQQHQMGSE